MNNSRRFSTLVVVVLALAACDNPPVRSDGGVTDRTLVILSPPGPDVGLSPGGETALRVRCTDASSRALPGVKIQFAIFQDPRGSTLSADAGVTDDDGVATVQLRAGAVSSRFQVRASSPGSREATFYIEVSDAGFGALLVSSDYQGNLDLQEVRYLLYYEQECLSLEADAAPPALRERIGEGVHQPVSFAALPLDLDHTILALASDRSGRVRARGCILVPRAVPRSSQPVRLLVPLTEIPPALNGVYQVTSIVHLPPSPLPGSRPLTDALRPWTDLTDCPRDPAQLLLDCILDALDGGDPLDCIVQTPSPPTTALLAERGVLVGSCRDALTSRGTPSLDQLLRDRMTATGKDTLATLILAPTSASDILRRIHLESRITLLALASTGQVLMAHELDAMGFGDDPPLIVFKRAELGLPLWLASPLHGQLERWNLTIEEHRFSLRLGLAARVALGQLVLHPAGLPETSAGVTGFLADLVQTPAGPPPQKGCVAIDALCCERARLPSGCLGEACAQGITALAAYLDAGFVRLDSSLGDLSLTGMVTLIDKNADLQVDAMGSKEDPGIWTTRITTPLEVISPAEAIFQGIRQ